MFSRKESLKQHVSYKHSRNEVRGARALVLVVEVQRAMGRTGCWEGRRGPRGGGGGAAGWGWGGRSGEGPLGWRSPCGTRTGILPGQLDGESKSLLVFLNLVGEEWAGT